MTTLEIVSVRDEETAAAWHVVDDATRSGDVPADPLWEVLPRVLATPATGERTELWVGTLNGEPIANGELSLPVLDNEANATVDVRVVAPHRRAAHGSTLLVHLLDRARDEGRSRVFGQIPEPLVQTPGDDTPGAAFAQARGARPVLSEVRRALDVTTVDDERLAALADEARTHAAGYSIVQWVDRAPDEYVVDFAALMARMSTDAPLEDMAWGAEVFDASRVRAREDAVIACQRRRIVTAARHDASGRLVGYTDIGVSRDRPRIAYQWDCIVQGDHRGHRLGLLMKIANLDLLRRTVSGVQLINTWNAAINRHMIAINEAMGFRAAEREREWQLDL